MSDWLNGLYELNRRGEAAVLVTVAETRGSTPRERGAKMIVGASEIWDTIGGGQLEHAAIESARLILDDRDRYQNLAERHELGPSLGQCCGGIADLFLERIPGRRQAWIDALVEARQGQRRMFMAARAGDDRRHVVTGPDDAGLPQEAQSLAKRAAATGEPVYDLASDGATWFVDVVPPADFNVVLFGAGHVGKATAGVLATLPCTLTWVDSRSGQLPADAAANVRIETTKRPEDLVHSCPPGSFYVVMTHSHPLDLAICARILARSDFAYCGLIGSSSKRRHFEKRLRLKGITDSALNRLTCPIGVAGISGKRPAEIAVSLAAELLRVKEAISRSDELHISTTG